MVFIFIGVAYILWAWASWAYCGFSEPDGLISKIIVIVLLGWVAIIWAIILKFFRR